MEGSSGGGGPPCMLTELPEHERTQGLCLVRDGPAVPLLQAAALRGFRKLTVPFLSRLYDLCKVEREGRKPRTEVTLLDALIRHCLPELDNAAAAAIIAARAKKTEELELASELFSDDVYKEIRCFTDDKDASEYQSLLEKSSRAPKGPAHHSKTGVPAVLEAARGRVDWSPDLDVEWARAHTPPCVGCGLSKETLWHFRWRGTYSHRPAGPFVVTRTWAKDNVDSCKVALAFVLAKLWECHEEVTGAVCPFSFEEL